MQDLEKKGADAIVSIWIKHADIEIGYTGDIGLLEKAMSITSNKLTDSLSVPMQKAAQGKGMSLVDTSDHSTSTIAKVLEAETGPRLLMAAAAKLAISDGKDRLSRKDILEEMKKGIPYYKQSYSNNMSSYLARLIKGGDLRIIGKKSYTLSPKAMEELRNVIQNANLQHHTTTQP